MFDSLKRLFNIAKAEVNSALDKSEDPVKLTEEGIAELKKDLNESMKALSEVNALLISERKELDQIRRKSREHENRAIDAIQRAERGQMRERDAERVGTEALEAKSKYDSQLVVLESSVSKYDEMTSKLNTNILNIKQEITNWESELKSLKARARVSEVSVNVNKQLSNLETSGTASRIDRMREQVEEQEILAESYESLVNDNKSLDDEINDALKGNGQQASNSFNQLRSKVNPSHSNSSTNTTSENIQSIKREEVKEPVSKAKTELEILRQKLKK